MVREEVVLGDSMEKAAMEWVEVAAPATVSEILAEYDRRRRQGHRAAASSTSSALGRAGAVSAPRQGSHAHGCTRYGLGIPPRPNPSSRPALNVPASHGRKSPRHLRRQRRRIVIVQQRNLLAPPAQCRFFVGAQHCCARHQILGVMLPLPRTKGPLQILAAMWLPASGEPAPPVECGSLLPLSAARACPCRASCTT